MDVPEHLLDGLQPAEVNAVRDWWLGLPETHMSELVALCDRRRDSCSFDTADPKGAVTGPHVVGGRFVPKRDTRGWKRWRARVFDYLMCHPEYAEPLVVRIFHLG